MTAKLLIVLVSGGITLATSVLVSGISTNPTRSAGLVFKAVQETRNSKQETGTKEQEKQNKTQDTNENPWFLTAKTETVTAPTVSPPPTKEVIEQIVISSTPQTAHETPANNTLKKLASTPAIYPASTPEIISKEPSPPPLTPTITPSVPPQIQSSKTNSKTNCELGQVNINTALKEELTEIKYIGEVRAGELISLRPFDALDDLIKIKGIGPKLLEATKEQGIACV